MVPPSHSTGTLSTRMRKATAPNPYKWLFGAQKIRDNSARLVRSWSNHLFFRNLGLRGGLQGNKIEPKIGAFGTAVFSGGDDG
jgi:hypothetical protein